MLKADQEMMEQCAEVCHECEDACLRAIAHGLIDGTVNPSKTHQTLLADCAAICAVSHNLLHRQSPQHIHTCRACAEICRRCAEACGRMAMGPGAMADCAAACHACAASCEAMSGMIRPLRAADAA